MKPLPHCLVNLFSRDMFYRKLSAIVLFFMLYHKLGLEEARRRIEELGLDTWFLPKPSRAVESFYANILREVFNDCRNCPLGLKPPACFLLVELDEVEKVVEVLRSGAKEMA